jgi:chemotaxis protein MotB
MGRRHQHEEHQNHEAWAIPYGDLITLLLAFFVVMYAMSSVNEGKYRVLSDSLNAAFRGAPRSMEPIQIGEKSAGKGPGSDHSPVDPALLEGSPHQVIDPVAIKTVDGGTGATSRPEALAASEQKPNDIRPAAFHQLERVAQQVESAMQDLVDQNVVAVRRHSTWVEVEIRTDILFPSGVATLSPSAMAVLGKLAATLKPFENPIRVEGHTDNRPISTAQFPSNWELSAARAGSVVHLFTSVGMEPSRLAVIGLGEFRPSQSNDTPEGRNANRRVLLVILNTDERSPEGGYAEDRGRPDPPVPQTGTPAPDPAPAAAPAVSSSVSS